MSGELSDLDSRASTAQQEAEKAEKKYEQWIFRRNLILGVLGFLVLSIGGTLGFVLKSDRFDMTPEEFKENPLKPFRQLKEWIKIKLDDLRGETNEKEAETYDWDGFD